MAFRDDLRATPDATTDHDAIRQRCQQMHPDDSHACPDCRSQWIQHTETIAMTVLK
ncbi:GrpB family protein [Komagataeibacter europaeus]|uniref:hypothetical protein n=1 Tax=Komagataeibacter europaeus TaxID=33995 RepID=UPI0038CD3C72